MADVPAAPRLEVLDAAGLGHDVFEVLTWTDQSFRVRAPARFEVGEELRVRIVRGRALSDGLVRVARHVADGDQVVTALDLLDETPVRSVITG